MRLFEHSRKGTAVCILGAALLFPAAAHAGIGDILSIFQAITGTVSGVIAPALADMQAIEARVRQLEQQVVWPGALIAQARSSVRQLRAQFTTAVTEIRSFRLNSATLASPSQLEKLLRGSQSSQIDQIENSYRSVFQPLPSPQSATAAQRALVDMDDASALSALKAAIASDAAGDRQLALADAMEQQTAGAAPGSAPLLAAQAQIAHLQSQAMLHRLLAVQLREEAALLAHDNTLRKQGAASLQELRFNLLRLLNRH